MSTPDDPFEEDEVYDIVHDAMTSQINTALATCEHEIDAAVRAVSALAEKLHETIPPSAVMNLVMSMAVGTALGATYDRPT